MIIYSVIKSNYRRISKSIFNYSVSYYYSLIGGTEEVSHKTGTEPVPKRRRRSKKAVCSKVIHLRRNSTGECVFFFSIAGKIMYRSGGNWFLGYRRPHLMTLCGLILVLRVLVIAVPLYIRFSTAMFVLKTE